MLPVTGGSDAHDVWYLGSGVTRFPGRAAADLRGALGAGTRARRRLVLDGGQDAPPPSHSDPQPDPLSRAVSPAHGTGAVNAPAHRSTTERRGPWVGMFPTAAGWIERGKGEPVVLLHGLMGEKDHWETTLEALAPLCRALAPELPIFDAAQAEPSVEAWRSMSTASWWRWASSAPCWRQLARRPPALELALERPERSSV